MKLLKILCLLLVSNLAYAQTDIIYHNRSLNSFQKDVRYNLNNFEELKVTPLQYTYLHHFKLHQIIQPFSLEETYPYFNLELSEHDIFEYQTGFESEPMLFLGLAENGINYHTFEDIYPSTKWVYTTNFDYRNSVNFYKTFPNPFLDFMGANGIMNSLIYQKDEYIRSTLELRFREWLKRIHFKFSHINNLHYRYSQSTPNFNGAKAFTFFPKKYNEQLNSDWGYSKEFGNQVNQGTALFSEVYIHVFSKCYLKFEWDTYQIFFPGQTLRQNFTTLGLGIQPVEGTVIFLEMTNRRGGFAFTSPSFFLQEEAYFAINAQRTLKTRIFNR